MPATKSCLLFEVQAEHPNVEGVSETADLLGFSHRNISEACWEQQKTGGNISWSDGSVCAPECDVNPTKAWIRPASISGVEDLFVANFEPLMDDCLKATRVALSSLYNHSVLIFSRLFPAPIRRS